MDVEAKTVRRIRSILLAGMLLLGVAGLLWVAFGRNQREQRVTSAVTPVRSPTITVIFSLMVTPSRTHVLLERSATLSPTNTYTPTITRTPTATLSSRTPNTATITGTRPTATRTYAPGEKSPTATWFIRYISTRTPVNLRTATLTKHYNPTASFTFTMEPTEPSISSSYTPTPLFTPIPIKQIGLSANIAETINIYLLQIFSDDTTDTVWVLNNALFWDWSPDGSRMLYESASDGGVPSGELWLADAEGGSAERLDNQPTGSNSQASWVAVGTAVPEEQWIICRNQNSTGQVDLFRVPLDGSDAENLTNDPDVVESDPAWRPDGSMVAFIQDGQIYILKISSHPTKVQLTTDISVKASPTWSADGTKLAWAQQEVTENVTQWEIYSAGYITDPTMKLTNITNRSNNRLADDTQPDWSADGTKILFISGRDPAGIYEWSPSTTKTEGVVTPVDTSLEGEQNPRYQPKK